MSSAVFCMPIRAGVENMSLPKPRIVHMDEALIDDTVDWKITVILIGRQDSPLKCYNLDGGAGLVAWQGTAWHG